MKTKYLAFLFILYSCHANDSFLEIDPVSQEENTAYENACIKHNIWTYEKMAYHYLWFSDMPDSLSLNFKSSPSEFFASLKSSQDRFSWCELNTKYTGDLPCNIIEGLDYQTYDISGVKINRVLNITIPYYEEFKIKRGDYFIINLESKTPLLCFGKIMKGKFICSQCIQALSSMTRGSNLAPTVSLDSVYVIRSKKIGYFVYDQFQSSFDVTQIIVKMRYQNIDDLILDVRYNPGGYVATSSYLASMIVPQKSIGKLYQLQHFNSKLTKAKKVRGGSGIDSVFLDKGPVTESRNLDLQRLVVLTTKNTASASESLIIGLRPYMKVVTIGTTSCGKDVGSYTIADNNYKYQLQPITFKYYNANNESTPTTGIVPDIYVEDDLDHQRGDTNEALLKAAIEYLTGEIQIGAVKDRSVSQPKMKEVGRSSIEIKNNL